MYYFYGVERFRYLNGMAGRKKNIYEKISMQPHGATDSASDFGSEGWGFESLWGCFLKGRAVREI